jgi:hypothetical protein
VCLVVFLFILSIVSRTCSTIPSLNCFGINKKVTKPKMSVAIPCAAAVLRQPRCPTPIFLPLSNSRVMYLTASEEPISPKHLTLHGSPPHSSHPPKVQPTQIPWAQPSPDPSAPLSPPARQARCPPRRPQEHPRHTRGTPEAAEPRTTRQQEGGS